MLRPEKRDIMSGDEAEMENNISDKVETDILVSQNAEWRGWKKQWEKQQETQMV